MAFCCFSSPFHVPSAAFLVPLLVSLAQGLSLLAFPITYPTIDDSLRGNKLFMKHAAKRNTQQGQKQRRQNRQQGQHIQQVPMLLCCEVLQGIKEFAEQELLRRFRERITFLEHENSDTIYLLYTGNLRDILEVRTIVAVYLVQQFRISRPRALLGHENFQTLIMEIQAVLALHPPHTFSSLRMSAAGENSRVFQALRDQISEATQLPYDADNGDLLLRIRPALRALGIWEVLIRLTPRPLSARAWRTYNMKGALNATVAAAMVEMTNPRPTDRFLNMMCGSGTLLVERLAYGPASVVVGIDIEVDALRGTLKNTQRGDMSQHVLLLAMDATNLPFLEHSFNVICADLPWGQLVGTHERNSDLYPRFLRESARVATPSARLIVLTHEIALFERVLQECSDVWELERVVKVFQGGLHPRIYELRRI